jgi:hypothetical protein
LTNDYVWIFEIVRRENLEFELIRNVAAAVAVVLRVFVIVLIVDQVGYHVRFTYVNQEAVTDDD